MKYRPSEPLSGRSPAYELVSLVHKYQGHARAFSRVTLHAAMRGAVNLACGACLRFAPADFSTFAKEFGLPRWAGDVNGHMCGERFYAHAAAAGNISACRSFETWKERPAFLFEGARLYVGADLLWRRKRLYVTSFSEDGTSLMACSYRSKEEHFALSEAKEALDLLAEQPAGDYHRRAPESRLRVTLPMLDAHNRAWKGARAQPDTVFCLSCGLEIPGFTPQNRILCPCGGRWGMGRSGSSGCYAVSTLIPLYDAFPEMGEAV